MKGVFFSMKIKHEIMRERLKNVIPDVKKINKSEEDRFERILPVPESGGKKNSLKPSERYQQTCSLSPLHFASFRRAK
ncbi:hypothetical protein TNCT_653481 [Trichonephila clavata]|uniref:Uncharacterized protein n=1 Tax=Trichonephila clavata TaxID=2740835 RepID=A0A8X6J8T2_TRICU|nr:hypothetical protein TNCT_653481 [Trichonephila clavata]